MGNIFRLTNKNEERLLNIDNNLNIAITHLLEKRNNISEENLISLKKINNDLNSSIRMALDGFYNINKEGARLSDLQKKEVILLIQDELYKARQQY